MSKNFWRLVLAALLAVILVVGISATMAAPAQAASMMLALTDGGHMECHAPIDEPLTCQLPTFGDPAYHGTFTVPAGYHVAMDVFTHTNTMVGFFSTFITSTAGNRLEDSFPGDITITLHVDNQFVTSRNITGWEQRTIVTSPGRGDASDTFTWDNKEVCRSEAGTCIIPFPGTTIGAFMSWGRYDGAFVTVELPTPITRDDGYTGWVWPMTWTNWDDKVIPSAYARGGGYWFKNGQSPAELDEAPFVANSNRVYEMAFRKSFWGFLPTVLNNYLGTPHRSR